MFAEVVCEGSHSRALAALTSSLRNASDFKLVESLIFSGPENRRQAQEHVDTQEESVHCLYSTCSGGCKRELMRSQRSPASVAAVGVHCKW